jgi:FAD:protein FMN transferase
LIAPPFADAVADVKATEGSERAFGRIQRARPLLGTLVAIAIDGVPAADAHELIGAGFETIEEIHRLMSFHAPTSDVSRLNREAAMHAVRVDPKTFAVLTRAVSFAAASDGAFDVTVGAKLVESGFLPRPEGACVPEPAASWRDIELSADGSVRFHRPLWIDVGGIAKGFAVDQAIERMASLPEAQRCVNAGGDLRVCGPGEQMVCLKLASRAAELPAVMLHNASLASSSGMHDRCAKDGAFSGPHIHGVYRRAIGHRSFVSVIARECVVADAFTKIVMAQGLRADALLRRFDATACLYHESRGWSRMGARA